MKTFRENPEGPENTAASAQVERDKFAARMAATSSQPDCPECGFPMDFQDTFGNLDHCLDAIGHPRDEWSRPRRPVKRGDIYSCPSCDESRYTYDGDDTIHCGYPC
jgi:hypothetical protein